MKSAAAELTRRRIAVLAFGAKDVELGRMLRNAAMRFAAACNVDSIFRKLSSSKLLIVCYHGIRPSEADERSWLLLDSKEFERQIRFMQEHFDVINIDSALERLMSGSLDQPTACVTFDDGYLNNYSLAFPILQALKVPATIYLSTGLIGTSRMLWTTTLELALRNGVPFTLNCDRFAHSESDIHTRGQAVALAKSICASLKNSTPSERDIALESIYSCAGLEYPEPSAHYCMMNWDQVRELAASGLITFGAHTVNHEIVSRLSDQKLDEEIGGSLAELRKQLGTYRPNAVSKTFAFPNGRAQDFDHRAIECLQRNGVTAALSTRRGLNSGSSPRFSLMRVVVGGDTGLAQFRAEASGVLDVLNRLGRA